MIILAIRNPRGMNFIHPTRDLLLQALSKPVAFSSFHFIQIGSHYLTTLACRDPHCTYRISPLRSATTSPHVGRSFIQVSIEQFPFLVAPHFKGSCHEVTEGWESYLRPIAASVVEACGSVFSFPLSVLRFYSPFLQQFNLTFLHLK